MQCSENINRACFCGTRRSDAKISIAEKKAQEQVLFKKNKEGKFVLSDITAYTL